MIKKFLEYFTERLDVKTYLSAADKLDTKYKHSFRSDPLRTTAYFTNYINLVRGLKEKAKFASFENGIFSLTFRKDGTEYQYYYYDDKLKISVNKTNVLDAVGDNIKINIQTILFPDIEGNKKASKTNVYISNIHICIESFYNEDECIFALSTGRQTAETKFTSIYNDINSCYLAKGYGDSYYLTRIEAIKIKKYLIEYLNREEVREEIQTIANDKGLSPSWYLELTEYVKNLSINAFYSRNR